MVLGGLVALSTVVRAQETNQAARKAGKGRFSVEQQLERWTEQLSLTDEQKPKVKAVLEESSKKRQEIFRDSNLDQQERREKMRAIMEDRNKKMKAILTEEQFKKYEEMMQRGKKGGFKKKAESSSQ
jgi:Spy/CpxP family protein refolding chaperone